MVRRAMGVTYVMNAVLYSGNFTEIRWCEAFHGDKTEQARTADCIQGKNYKILQANDSSSEVANFPFKGSIQRIPKKSPMSVRLSFHSG